MASGRKNISRSFLRVFEILLFFVISVVGFNVLAKTTSQNGKSKTRSSSQYTLLMARLASPELQYPPRSDNFFISGHTTLIQKSSPLSFHAPVAIAHYAYSALPSDPVFTPEKTPYPVLFLQKPANLLQQNPVLLI
jgi:hypothetical protein